MGAEPEAEPKQSMKVEPEPEAELEHRTSSDCASASGAAGRLVTESVPGTFCRTIWKGGAFIETKQRIALPCTQI